ncbi:MAG: DUF3794 domain-containing protein [Clostridia bacterium]|nr:DUF3794 domain-containing protein [Clostridia bacterium]
MEENNGIKVAHVINLPTLNIKSQLNMNIDSNTHIKQVLNIETCLIDSQIEPLFNKAIVKGSVGIKVVYIDTDNMYNSLSDSVNFSETINSENITADCEISVNNSQFIAEFDNDDKMLRVNIEGSLDCLCSLNAGLNTFNQSNDNLITKKSVLQACTCIQKISKTTNYDFDFRLGSKISKMLSCDSKVIVDDAKCYDGYILLNGQIFNTIMYETDNDDNHSIKICTNSTPFKCEVEASSCDNECVADISAYINLNSTQITPDISDNDTHFNFEYCIVVSGYVYKTINMDVIDDLYSLDNEVEIIRNNYDVCKKMPCFKSNENIDAEITLADELNVDEILGMINTSASVTQYSVRDNLIVVEGVISGNLLYFDENREIKHLPTQIPYSVNIKQELNDEICALHLSAVPSSCKCKIKRGNTLMVDYEFCITGSAYIKNKIELIDNVKYGKAINYGDIAFQIYIAHSNESCWDLCKRLHITQDKLIMFNKENPATYSGGEKVIVYR